MTPIEQILDLARWAPSGDNTQPWRFAIDAADRVTVFGRDTRAHCVYDLDGHASQVSIGALLETMSLAATRFGLATHIEHRSASPDDAPVFDVTFAHRTGVQEDPLVRHIEERRVNRRPLRTRALAADAKRQMQDAVGPQFAIRWFEGWRGRARVARLNFRSAKIRLTIPEAYEVHRSVIEWNTRSSEDRIPGAALGASAPTLALMRWGMASWQRVDWLNRYAAGTVAPRLELDVLPSMACAAHWALIATEPPRVLDDYVAAGRAVQRFWLTATRLSLQCQPEYTPLVFARYAREGLPFSTNDIAAQRAAGVAGMLDDLLGADIAPRAVFMGRIGAGNPATARSVRLPVESLVVGASGER
jgi:nitroreductase